MHVAVGLNGRTQPEVCEVIQFLADHGAKLDEMNAAGRTPIALADGLPVDLAVDLLTKLITESGEKPKIPSKRLNGSTGAEGSDELADCLVCRCGRGSRRRRFRRAAAAGAAERPAAGGLLARAGLAAAAGRAQRHADPAHASRPGSFFRARRTTIRSTCRPSTIASRPIAS